MRFLVCSSRKLSQWCNPQTFSSESKIKLRSEQSGVPARGASRENLCMQVSIQHYTSVLSLHLINFLIPKIPKTDLGSSQIVESDGTLGIAKTNNVPHFYTHFIIQKFLLLLQGCLCGVEVACWVYMLRVSGSNPVQAEFFNFFILLYIFSTQISCFFFYIFEK